MVQRRYYRQIIIRYITLSPQETDENAEDALEYLSAIIIASTPIVNSLEYLRIEIIKTLNLEV